MPTLTLVQAEGLVVRTLTRCRTGIDNARSVARALIAAEMDGLKGHGLSRVPMYAAQAKVRKIDGMATPSRHAPAARPDRDRRGQRICLSGDRAGRSRAAGGRAQPGHRRGGDPPFEPLRRGGPSGRAAGGEGPGRADVRQHAGRDGAVGRIESGVRHQPGRLRLSAARPRAAGHRPVAVEGRARQRHDGETARRKHSRGLGAGCRGQADHRSRRGAARHDGADGRRQGHGAGADGRAAGGGADRLELRRRGVVLSRRRGRAVRHRAIDHRVRSGGVRRRRAGALRAAGGVDRGAARRAAAGDAAIEGAREGEGRGADDFRRADEGDRGRKFNAASRPPEHHAQRCVSKDGNIETPVLRDAKPRSSG